jgi:NAD(P)-dependent dehydrogenase (short-subunit alcohol dehydrogenase family)
VYASVKDEEELERIKKEIKTRGIGRSIGSIRPLIMDVLSYSSISSAAEQINSEIGNSTSRPLIGVVNNAGYCMISPMELTPEKAVRGLFELDFWAYIAVIREFLPLIKKNQGRFINVCSYGAYVNPPIVG